MARDYVDTSRPTPEVLDHWEKESGMSMQSAVDEYCPEALRTLIKEVRRYRDTLHGIASGAYASPAEAAHKALTDIPKYGD